jgi:hypothetical protein
VTTGDRSTGNPAISVRRLSNYLIDLADALLREVSDCQLTVDRSPQRRVRAVRWINGNGTGE